MLHVVPGALRADDVLPVLPLAISPSEEQLTLYLDESFPHHGHLALGTKEALVVPAQRLKGHKFCASKSSFAWQNIQVK